MTLLDYANWVPLPAPLAAAAPITSFTSPDGEVWVAKGGVNGGQWRKARDVLYAHVYIAAPATGNTGQVALNFDTPQRDVYGMWNGSNGLQAPIGGTWRYESQAICGFGATSNTLAIWGFAGGQNLYYCTSTGSGGFGGYSVSCYGSKAFYFASGLLFTTQFRQSAVANLIAGQALTFATLTYVGTG